MYCNSRPSPPAAAAAAAAVSGCRFEASGMTVAPTDGGRDWLWIVFDNLLSIGRVNEQFEFR
jgi:hypothetical protein